MVIVGVVLVVHRRGLVRGRGTVTLVRRVALVRGAIVTCCGVRGLVHLSWTWKGEKEREGE